VAAGQFSRSYYLAGVQIEAGIRRNVQAGLLLVLCLTLSVSAATPSASAAQRQSYFRPCVQEGQPPPFTNYFLGDSFDGYPLTITDYFCSPPFPQSTGFARREQDISFGYSDCNIPGHGGHCVPQVVVRSAAVCDENYFLSGFGPSGSPSSSRRPLTNLRGVPAVIIDGNDPQIRLYTGDASVNVYGQTLDQLKRAVDALRPAPQSIGGAIVGSPLPTPVAGAMDGTIACGLSFSHFGTKRIRSHISLEMRLPRPARVTGWAERRPGSRVTAINFKARRGLTKRTLRLHRGRYHGVLLAEDSRGRHTGPRRLHFLVR
jgi:hypothetical protein